MSDGQSPRASEHELLLRHLDGHATREESARVVEALRKDGELRDFLREVAEQSVIVADLERTAQAVPVARPSVPLARLRPWQWALAGAAAVLLLAVGVAVAQFVHGGKAEVARVAKVTGSTRFFGSTGALENALETTTRLTAGDSLESRSCDAWIELALRDGTQLTMGGHSALRILDDEGGGTRLNLARGNIWISPGTPAAARPLTIETPTAVVETRGAQFDLQTSDAGTLLRVNRGAANIRQVLDGRAADVPAGHQAAVALSRAEPLSVRAQPRPVSRWMCDLDHAPELPYGKWLPPRGTDRLRLGAAPLLWPLPKRAPVLLHVVALSALRSSERPVLAHSDSTLIFRGRTARSQMVRFGFSTQKMRGVFAGKFEVDVPAAALGPVGEEWEVRLPLSGFRALQPQLSLTPDGLEVNDVYALTLVEDAGLEITRIELVPNE